MKKRKLEIAVISDVYLGSAECRADELVTYLNSVQPRILVLNGNIIDRSKDIESNFPAAHLRVLRKLVSMAFKGTKVYYLTGNHDAGLRKFTGTALGNIRIEDRLLLQIDAKKMWFFHGDVFDVSPQNAKHIAKLGDFGHNILIKMSRFDDWLSKKTGKPLFSHTQNISPDTQNNEKYLDDFERTAVELAINNDYDYVFCGHVHSPKKQVHNTKFGRCTYLNSGDWVKNLTALEYSFKRWKIHRYNHEKLSPFIVDEEIKDVNMNALITKVIANRPPELVKEINRLVHPLV